MKISYKNPLPALLSIAIALCILLSPAFGEEFDPAGILLTWQRDPTTTMTVDWHSTPDDGERKSVLEYKKRGSDEWQKVTGSAHPFPYSNRTIHRAEVTGLQPATGYDIRFGEDSQSYWFRTMPANNEKPIQFAVGGDLGVSEAVAKQTRVAMQYDPEFFLWGGDIAYANDDPTRAETWYKWFEIMKESGISEDGRVIPIIAAIGDHEALGGNKLSRVYEKAAKGDEALLKVVPYAREGMSEEEQKEAVKRYMTDLGIADNLKINNDFAIFYYSLFPFPGGPAAYNVLDFGRYMSIITLNSGHGRSGGGSEGGAQRKWLEEALKERAGKVTNIFPISHHQAYPGKRNADNFFYKVIRENWVPLYEKYGVRVAFEAHDHVYKRTVPIREEKESADGIVFMGDGGWGHHRAETNDVEKTWYLEKAEPRSYALIVTLKNGGNDYQAVDINGEVFDRYRQPHK